MNLSDITKAIKQAVESENRAIDDARAAGYALAQVQATKNPVNLRSFKWWAEKNHGIHESVINHFLRIHRKLKPAA